MSTQVLETRITLPEIGTTALEVTQQDVALGIRARLTSCPVATALKRITGKDAIVYSTGVRVCDASGVVARFRTSSDLDQMIQAYDKGADFQPGYYTLTPYK
jgi:hypothetical protein